MDSSRRRSDIRQLLATVALGMLALTLALTPWRVLRTPLGRSAAEPQPDWHEARADWFALADRIETPPELRPFEPIMEELTGEPPLSYEAVRFLPRRDALGGLYRAWEIEIFGTADPDRSGVEYRCPEVVACNLELCSGEEPADEVQVGRLGARVLATWAHEQGHHYGRPPFRWRRPGVERRWVEQIEAEALVFAFAEHVGERYSPELGVHLLGQRLRPATDEFLRVREITREKLVNRLPWPDPDEKGAWVAAVLVLRGSGLDSFAEVWRFVHGTPAEEVAERIRTHVERLDEGHRAAVALLLGLEGQQFAPAASALEFRLPPAEMLGEAVSVTRGPGSTISAGGDCLEVAWPRHVLAFCAEAWDGWIDLAQTGPEARRLARIGTQRFDRCLVATGWAGDSPQVLSLEERRPSVRSVVGTSSPCLCRMAERLLSDAQAEEHGARFAAAFAPVLEAALRAVHERGDASDLAFVAAVASHVSQAHPALAIAPPDARAAGAVAPPALP